MPPSTPLPFADGAEEVEDATSTDLAPPTPDGTSDSSGEESGQQTPSRDEGSGDGPDCYNSTFVPVLSYFIACAFLLHVVIRITRTQMLALLAYTLAYTLCWSIDHLINAALRYSYPSSSPVDPFYLRDPMTHDHDPNPVTHDQ